VDPRRYGNRRAEGYGEFGRRVDPRGDFAESPFALVDDTALLEELTAPQKVFVGNDGLKYYLTPKSRRGGSEKYKGKTITELLGRSPDKGDAVVICQQMVPLIGMTLQETLDQGFW